MPAGRTLGGPSGLGGFGGLGRGGSSPVPAAGSPAQGTPSTPPAGEQAKSVAKGAIKEAAKGAATGAATGGLAGAGVGAAKGILITLWRNPASRAMMIGGVAAVIFGPILMVMGIVMMTNVSTSTSPDNDVAVTAVTSSGLTSDQINTAEEAVDGTSIPWEIDLAYNQTTGQTLDANALQSAMNTPSIDKNNQYRDLLGGTVNGSDDSGYQMGTTTEDQQYAQNVQNTYVEGLTAATGITTAQATSIFQEALGWAMGQSTGCTNGDSTSNSVTGDGTAPSINPTTLQGTTPTFDAPYEAGPPRGGTFSTLSATQVNNARVIMGMAKTIFTSVPASEQEEAAVIAVATANTETDLENTPEANSDGTSAGMFQQTQQAQYSPLPDRLLADYSSTWFLNHVAAQPDWDVAPVATIAQRIQVSAPDAYAKSVTLADDVVAAYWAVSPALPMPSGVTPVTPTAGNVPQGSDSSTPATTPAIQSACGGGSLNPADPGPSSSPTGGGFAPNSSQVEIAIEFAESQIGKPYALDGAGPNSWDCSGLTMMSYRQAGVDIGEHLVSAQYYTMQSEGRILPYSDRERGDLLFWADGDDFYHVAIYLGKAANGEDMMVAAPALGEDVKIQQIWTTPGEPLAAYVGRPTGTP